VNFESFKNNTKLKMADAALAQITQGSLKYADSLQKLRVLLTFPAPSSTTLIDSEKTFLYQYASVFRSRLLDPKERVTLNDIESC
jgi:hypothetical protein